MATLHRTIEKAIEEARDLIKRYKVMSAIVLRVERVYGDNFEEPGFEALTYKELTEYKKYSRNLNIVAHVRKDYN